MAKVVNSFDELVIMMNDAMIGAVDYVADKMIEELYKSINQVVYGAGEPRFYERTFEFLNSWEKTTPVLKNHIVESEIFQKVLAMSYNPELGQHGSYEEGDLREQLASMLANGWGAQDSWYNRPRDFWEPFIKFSQENISRWFQEGMAREGVPLQASISLSTHGA